VSSREQRVLGRLVVRLDKADGWVAPVEAVLAIVTAAGMLVLVAAPMVIRKLPAGTAAAVGDYAWMPQAARLLLIWSAFLGASLATRARRHIVIDVVTKSISRRSRAWASVAASVVAAGLCATLAVAATHVVHSNWDQATVLPGIKSGPAHIIVPLALGIIALRFLKIGLEDLDGALSGDLEYLARYEHDEAAAHAPPPEGAA